MKFLRNILDSAWDPGLVFQNTVVSTADGFIKCCLHSVRLSSGEYISSMIPMSPAGFIGFSGGSLSSYVRQHSKKFNNKEEWDVGKFTTKDAEQLLDRLNTIHNLSVTGVYGKCNLLGTHFNVGEEAVLDVYYSVDDEVYLDKVNIFQTYPYKNITGYGEMISALGLTNNFYVAIESAGGFNGD